MSLPSNRRTDPGVLGPETILVGIAVGLILIIGGSLYAATRIGHQLAGTADTLPADPFAAVIGLFTGKVTWPPAGTSILAAAGAVAIVLAVLMIIAWRMINKNTTRADRAAAVLGSGKEIEPLSKKNAIKTADRLGVIRVGNDPPGVAIGRTVRGNAPLFGTYEDTHLDIWGSRTGKTTSRAIPAIMDAPGAVLVTSNKRDIVDATRDGRAAVGPVVCFDAQGLVGEEPSWYWPILSYVTDEVRAAKLAEHFATGSREPGARTDAFFDPAAQDLVAALLLAGALDRRPITDVYIWVTRPSDDEPVEILRRHDYPLIEQQLAGVINAPEKQRGGIYGTAQQMLACLTNRKVLDWITPRNGGWDPRPRFDPARFVEEGGTLYSLSKEGRGNVGPLVTALTVAVVEAAEELAAQSHGGRLPVPLLCVLDEAANVCRWKELPNLYSHYGSRGIILMTILQTWSQGVDVWGESGMNKLFSAANIFLYGGGAREDRYLETISKLLGDYDRISTSVTTGRGQRTVSRQLVRQRIFDVEQLASLPKGRAIVLASGARATLIRTQPWMTGPHADSIRASILAHDPEGSLTIAKAERDELDDDVTMHLATKEVDEL